MKLLPIKINDFNFIQPCIKSKRLQYQYSANVFEYPFNRDNFEKYVIEYEKELNSQYPLRLFFKMVNSSGEFIGNIAFYQINYALRSATLGLVLIVDKYQKKGFNQEMLKLMLNKAFNELRLHRVELIVFDFNKNAINSYEKFGFKKEGLLREVIRVEGEYWSAFMMSMLSYEFKEKYEN